MTSSDGSTLITRIGFAPLDLPVKGTLRWGRSSSLAHIEHLLLGIELAGGDVGIAELAVRPTIYGETREGSKVALREHFAPALIGLDALDDAASSHALEALPFNFALRGALDLALADVRARLDGDGLGAAQVGPNRHPRVSTILGIASVPAMLEEARRAVDAGVHVLKVKVGRNERDDDQVLSALATEFGDSVTIYVDANEAWTAEQAPGRLEGLAGHGVAYVEEPLPITALKARAALRSYEILPLIADDSCFRPADLERELEANTFDILNVKPARSGWSESLTMVKRAVAAGKGVMVGSQACSGLGTMHAALVASQAGVTHPSELSFPLRLEADSLDLPPPVSGGTLDVARYAGARLRPELWRPTWLTAG